MATSTNRSRLFPARSRKSYRLEMESRTLYLLLSMMVLTGVLVFYLGVVTGKATRDPNVPQPLSAELRTPGTAPGSDADRQRMGSRENLLAEKGALDNLRQDENQATQRTENLLKNGGRLKLEEIPPAPEGNKEPDAPKTAAAPPAQPPAAPKAERTPPPPAPATARNPAPPEQPDDGSLYTVQVFSSRHQKNAQELATRLRDKGFPAYINRFQSSDDKVYYRVRVGKTNRSNAMDLSDRLKREANLRDPQVTKL